MDVWIKIIAWNGYQELTWNHRPLRMSTRSAGIKKNTLSSKYQELAEVYIRQDVFFKPEILMKHDSMVI